MYSTNEIKIGERLYCRYILISITQYIYTPKEANGSPLRPDYGCNLLDQNVIPVLHMMTSSNGNIFRVTGHLCGEFTGHM